MENICFNCERSEVWPASIEGPEEIVCTQRAALLAIEKRVNAAFNDWSYREAVVEIDEMIKKVLAR